VRLSLTFVVPALNEEGNLAATIQAIDSAASGLLTDYEVIVVDDGSSDGTGRIADGLAAQDERRRVVHHRTNRGLGYSYREGVRLATCDHVLMVPGDNEISGDSIRALLAEFGRADIINAYPHNPEVRPLGRRLLSLLFVQLFNRLFGLRLRYYNGPAVQRADLVRACAITTDGFLYHAEVMVQLVKSGASYIEVGMTLRRRDYGGSKALRWSNFVGVARTIYALCRRGLWQRGRRPRLRRVAG